MRTPPTLKRKSQSEMQQARGRMRNALHESIADSENGDDDNSSEDANGKAGEDEEYQDRNNHVQRGRPPKTRHDSGSLLQSPVSSRQLSLSPVKKLTPARRRRQEEQLAMQQLQRIQAESFIMKLFDRSLDLSKYTEVTSLYPICRAWMANQPRNASIQSSNRRTSSPDIRHATGAAELLAKLKRGEIREVKKMPAAKEIELPKWPQVEPTFFKEEANNLNNASKDELLANHISKWKITKSNWVKHSKRYQQRYELNHKIIQELYKP